MEGYKKTKLGWIPNDWKTDKLVNIIDDTSPICYGIVQVKDNIPNGIPVIAIRDFDSFNEKHIHRVSKKIEKSYPRSRVTEGVLLISIKGTIGKLFIVPNNFNGNISRDVGKLKIKSLSLRNFIFQLFQSYQYQCFFDKVKVGSTRYELSIHILKKIPIYFPPKEKEQKAIADCLSHWDEAILLLDQLIEQKELQKKWLMQQLLTGKKRLEGFSGVWKEVTFNDIIERVKRKNTELNDNVITISAQRGFVRQEDFFNKRVASKTLSNYYLLHRGEFAYNKSYSKGYPMGAFKRLDAFDKAVVTTLYICFRCKENVDSDFILHFFEGGMMVKGLKRIAQEGGRAHGLLNISLPDFFGLKLRIPDLPEQKAIVTILNDADNELTLLQEKLSHIKEQKKGMMQQLLTGKKRLV